MADELVLRCVPRHDATKVRADGVDAVILNFIVARYRQVGSVALEDTNELRHVAQKRSYRKTGK